MVLIVPSQHVQMIVVNADFALLLIHAVAFQDIWEKIATKLLVSKHAKTVGFVLLQTLAHAK